MQPGLKYLLDEELIKQTKVIVPANIDPSVCLENATCKELNRLPLDHPNALVEDKKLLNGLILHFYFNRKFPLIRYDINQEGHKNQLQCGKKHMFNGETKQHPTSGCSDKGTDIAAESSILLLIKSFPPMDNGSILVTGDTPAAQIAKIDNIDDEMFSVFIVPHQESKECICLSFLKIQESCSATLYCSRMRPFTWLFIIGG